MTRAFSIRWVTGRDAERLMDHVAEEEPLAILVRHWQKDASVTESLAVTMRTPGHDKELAAGLLLFFHIRSAVGGPRRSVAVLALKDKKIAKKVTVWRDVQTAAVGMKVKRKNLSADFGPSLRPYMAIRIAIGTSDSSQKP